MAPDQDLRDKWAKITDPIEALETIIEEENFLGFDPYYRDLRSALLGMAERVAALGKLPKVRLPNGTAPGTLGPSRISLPRSRPAGAGRRSRLGAVGRAAPTPKGTLRPSSRSLRQTGFRPFRADTGSEGTINGPDGPERRDQKMEWIMDHIVTQGTKTTSGSLVIYPWTLTHELRLHGSVLEQRWRREKWDDNKGKHMSFVGYEYMWQPVPTFSPVRKTKTRKKKTK